jgi:meiotically up-regulated gene 157 (Mug157) protein
VRAGVCLAFVLSAAREGAACDTGFVTASASLVDLYFTAYDQVLAQHMTRESDGTTYVSTGDIRAEWLRDSSAVARAYVGSAKADASVAQTIRGIVARQARYILLDPYANAFSEDYVVIERKFEADSLLYPVWLAYSYWQATGDATIFTPEEGRALDTVMGVLRTEQRHDERSTYRHPDLPRDGRGSPVAFTGMLWSGFRPSDDPTRYGYNIPVNAFATVVLREFSEIEKKAYRNQAQAANAWGLSVQVQRGIEQSGVVDDPRLGKVYAYEVDGLGHTNLMDDANMPSLLSMPYFGYVRESDPIYQSTRGFVLSSRDPYFYAGTVRPGHRQPAHATTVRLAPRADRAGAHVDQRRRNDARARLHCGVAHRRRSPARILRRRRSETLHARRLRVAKRAVHRADHRAASQGRHVVNDSGAPEKEDCGRGRCGRAMRRARTRRELR